MTDHPKPARYFVTTGAYDVPTVDEADPDGNYVLYDDHEAALAARDEQWRTAIEAKAREFAEKGQQADQRCAAAQRGNDAVKVNATAMEAATYAECASELLALLEKKP